MAKNKPVKKVKKLTPKKAKTKKFFEMREYKTIAKKKKKRNYA